MENFDKKKDEVFEELYISLLQERKVFLFIVLGEDFPNDLANNILPQLF